ncbi:42232_t:CDS:2, partial [Gigaspora margarita]
IIEIQMMLQIENKKNRYEDEIRAKYEILQNRCYKELNKCKDLSIAKEKIYDIELKTCKLEIDKCKDLSIAKEKIYDIELKTYKLEIDKCKDL